MKTRKLFLLTLCLGSSLAFSTSCQKESNITKVCMLKTVDSMNLYLTAVAKGNVGSTYIYLNDHCDSEGKPILTHDKEKNYTQEVYDKASNAARANCDIAYFPVSDDEGINAVKKLFSLDTEKIFQIVYFDSYNENESKPSEITGIWVARKKWINNKNGTGRKFIDGLAKAANYRASKMKDKTGKETSSTNNDYKMFHEKFNDKTFDTFNDMYTFMDSKKNEMPEYIFADDKNESRINFKSIYEYCALFAMQNTGALQPFNDAKVLNHFKNNSMKDDGNEHFINNDTSKEYFGQLKNIGKMTEGDIEITEKGKTLINGLKAKLSIEDDRLSLDLMRHGIAHAEDKSSSSGMSKVILWSAIGGGLLVIVVTLLVIRRVKTGKKLFDIKKALDSDIDPEDPRIIRMKKVGKDLKALREKKKIPLNIAAKEMHIPSIYIKDVIEEGEVVLNKRLRKKYIAYYKLPADYFDKAYKLDK